MSYFRISNINTSNKNSIPVRGFQFMGPSQPGISFKPSFTGRLGDPGESLCISEWHFLLANWDQYLPGLSQGGDKVHSPGPTRHLQGIRTQPTLWSLPHLRKEVPALVRSGPRVPAEAGVGFVHEAEVVQPPWPWSPGVQPKGHLPCELQVPNWS